jgi:hypothetical protein
LFFYFNLDGDISVMLPCPQPDCSNNDNWYKNINSHHITCHADPCNLSASEDLKKERRGHAMLKQIILSSTHLVSIPFISVTSICNVSESVKTDGLILPIFKHTVVFQIKAALIKIC